MPTCPGCETSVPHDRLDTHERYCGGIWGESARTADAIERLDRRLQRIEDEVGGSGEEGWAGLAVDEPTSPREEERRK